MIRWGIASLVALVAALALLLLLPAPRATGEPGGDAPAIRITDRALEPEVLHLGPQGRVSWSNEDAWLVALSFGPDLSDALLCPDVEHRPGYHPDFHPQGRSELVSTPIRADSFALPCPLPPGDHRYEVHLLKRDPPGAVAVPEPLERIDATLAGRIVVTEEGSSTMDSSTMEKGRERHEPAKERTAPEGRDS